MGQSILNRGAGCSAPLIAGSPDPTMTGAEIKDGRYRIFSVNFFDKGQ
jgi:hypothetical protein